MISHRAVRRRETRERVYDAALVEVARSGFVGADIGAIAAAAGVARGTFYFHFPTKEHVLIELERREELRIVASLQRSPAPAGDLREVFAAIVRQVRAAERRLGPRLFREMLSVHFGAGSSDDGLDRHPLATFIVEAVGKARQADRVAAETDATAAAVIFLTGLFALLATRPGPSKARAALLDTYVATVLDGMVRS